MQQYMSEHYIFHYSLGTKAEEDVESIAAHQEACYTYITSVLGVNPDYKIQYFLCDSPEEVGRIYGDNEACSGFASPPDKIYAVYNAELQCIGFHEDVHIISHLINRPDSAAIREGLAMYFDRKWWGMHNIDWCAYYLKSGHYIPVDELLDDEIFFSENCSITYPTVGAFTDWLITSYGMERYLSMYRQQDMNVAILNVYGATPKEMAHLFKEYVELFRVDSTIENKMDELLSECGLV